MIQSIENNCNIYPYKVYIYIYNIPFVRITSQYFSKNIKTARKQEGRDINVRNLEGNIDIKKGEPKSSKIIPIYNK